MAGNYEVSFGCFSTVLLLQTGESEEIGEARIAAQRIQAGIHLQIHNPHIVRTIGIVQPTESLVLLSTATDDYNAIDPNFVLDRQHHAWLAFGSIWSGIKLRRLNDKTGLAGPPRLYSLATRRRPANAEPAPPGLPPNWEAVEAPFIVHHGGYFYLFVSWDLCCRGTQSTYRTMVGRAAKVTGPYVDAKGVSMMQGGGTELLTGDARWVGPGGESILMQPSCQDIIVFHAYDARTGRPALQVSTLVWRDGWPHAALEP